VIAPDGCHQDKSNLIMTIAGSFDSLTMQRQIGKKGSHAAEMCTKA